jgi:hypothetical protein
MHMGLCVAEARDPFARASPAAAFEAVVPDDCDMYVVGLQEAKGVDFFEKFENHMSKIGAVCMQVKGKSSKVKGRGDSALITGKLTTMRCYAKKSVQPFVTVFTHWSVGFGKRGGSKGANGLGLRVHDTTLAFVNCHLAALIGKDGSDEMRQSQYAKVVDTLGNKLGNEFFQLNKQCHHVIWMGDLNYRLELPDSEIDTCIQLLSEGKNGDLFHRYDTLHSLIAKGDVFGGYIEPDHDFVNFPPSYKKYKERTEEDRSDPDWVKKVYLVDYTQQWYKGGKQKVRIPGWTDRVLVKSQSDRKSSVACSDYRSITDHFLTSDHSPVQAVVALQVKKLPDLPVSMYKLRLHNCVVVKADNSPFSSAPKHLKIVAPAPFELKDRPPIAKKLEMADIQPDAPGQTFFFTGMSAKLAASGVSHHFLAKVTFSPALKGEVAVPVQLSDFIVSAAATVDR